MRNVCEHKMSTINLVMLCCLWTYKLFLESVYTPKGYPEFESRSLRKKRAENQQNMIDLSAFSFFSGSKKSFKKNDWKDEKGRKRTKKDEKTAQKTAQKTARLANT